MATLFINLTQHPLSNEHGEVVKTSVFRHEGWIEV